jgi:hypothetical protein
VVLLICGLGSYVLVELCKLIVEFRHESPVKLLLALALSLAGAAIFYRQHPAVMVAYGVAGSGLASVTHRLARYAYYAGDQAYIGSARGRRR